MIIIADNLQGSRGALGTAFRQGDPGPVQDLARRLERAGARMIDINVGPPGRNTARKMAFLVEAVQSASNLPVLLDTADPEVMGAGLEANRGTAVLNGFSLEPKRLEPILALAVRHGTDTVGYLLDEHGRPPASLDHRLGIAVEVDQAARSAGLSAERLILDPFVAPLIWEDGHRRNAELLEVIRRLPETLGRPVRTVVGLSNLTTGLGASDRDRKRRAERAFLPMLASAGLTMVMLDVFQTEAVRLVRACESLLSPKVFAWEAL
jgi:5-methyltetrahydrofolate corrinoid/iron sulfur protein methyltransferase